MDRSVVSLLGGRAQRHRAGLASYAPPKALAVVDAEPQRGIPAIARDDDLSSAVETAVATAQRETLMALGWTPPEETQRLSLPHREALE